MPRRNKDIQGYRRSHKRIPTSMALTDDQAELQAKQSAIGRMTPQAPAGKGHRSLKSFRGNNMGQMVGPAMPGQPMGPVLQQQRFEQQGIENDSDYDLLGNQTQVGNLESERKLDPRVFSSPYEPGGTAEDYSQRNLQDFDANDPEGLARFLAAGGYGELGGPGGQSGGGLGDPGVEEETPDERAQVARDILADQYDPEAREKRIARARAQQEAMVQAQLGSGEAAMSGASALLQGDAGRLAEQQARTGELEREMGIAGLSLELAGFDLDKERYDKIEKRGIALAALYAAEYMDADSAAEIYDALGIPEAARDPAAMAALENFLFNNRDDDGDGVANVDDPEHPDYQGTEAAEEGGGEQTIQEHKDAAADLKYGEGEWGSESHITGGEEDISDKFWEYLLFWANAMKDNPNAGIYAINSFEYVMAQDEFSDASTIGPAFTKVQETYGFGATGNAVKFFNDSWHQKYSFVDPSTGSEVTVWRVVDADDEQEARTV